VIKKFIFLMSLISCGKPEVIPTPPVEIPVEPVPQPVPVPSPVPVPPIPQILPVAASLAITEACAEGHKDVNLSLDECILILSGASLKESGWNVNKECQAWGNELDPACGLTQSRKSDGVAVGLTCDPTLRNPEGYKCNALTGIRNLRCKADNGLTCDLISPGRSLYVGIKKHLGQNLSALPEYLNIMQQVYNNKDIRLSFRINEIKPWVVILLEENL
jgi:hypothetical protein